MICTISCFSVLLNLWSLIDFRITAQTPLSGSVVFTWMQSIWPLLKTKKLYCSWNNPSPYQPLPCQTQLSDPTAPTPFAGGTLLPLGAPSPPSPWRGPRLPPQPPPSQLKSSSASAAGRCPWWPSRRKIQLKKNKVIPQVTNSQCRSPLATKASNYWSIWSKCDPYIQGHRRFDRNVISTLWVSGFFGDWLFDSAIGWCP